VIDLGPQPTLLSERLWLTSFAMADAQAVFEYARNPRVSEHTTWLTHRSVADAKAFIEMVQSYETEFCWAIRLEEDGRARGAIEFGLGDEETGSVHYVLAEELWNQGIMTEAVCTVVGWAFRSFASLQRVETGATSANFGSRRVLEKCGFRLTEVVNEKWAKFNQPVELAVYSLTRGHWTDRIEAR
jgi:ribosomal-protein-alanine N-acetyltransferase